MIKIDHLVKNYGTNCAVDDISFEIAQGEIVGFLGPNGAGKSTTMNMITGYLSSSSGSITIDGDDVLENPLAAKKMVGYLRAYNLPLHRGLGRRIQDGYGVLRNMERTGSGR